MKSLVLLALIAGCASADAEPPSTVADATSDALGEVVPEASVDTAPEASTEATTCTKLVKPFSSKDLDCNACAEAKCCAEVNGCLGDTRCDDDYVNCILACALLPADAGDAGAEKERCVNECGASAPEGKKRYDAAFGCVDSKCATECG